MTEKRCPTEAELIGFVDADLSPEQLQRIEKHLELCSSCARQAMLLSTLVRDLAAPLSAPPLDVTEHVQGVMTRLDTSLPVRRWSRFGVWGGAAAAAAGALLLLGRLPGAVAPSEQTAGELAARGGPEATALSRYVGVQLYAQQPELTPLDSGSRIGARAPLTAGLRNLAKERAYLLLFAVDARSEVHWIAPEHTSAGSDPEAMPIAPAATEQLLPTAVVFDDLAPGPLRVVSVISHTPLRVSEVESLPAAELSAEKLLQRFPRAEVRQFLLEVQPEARP